MTTTIPAEDAPSQGEDKPILFGGLQVRSAAEMLDAGYAMFIYSRGGGGKTTLAAGASELGKVLFLDAEGGTKVVSDKPDIDVIQVTTWQEIDRFRRTVEQTKIEDLPWRTIVFDNLSEYTEMCLKKIAGMEQPTWPEYGELAREILSFVRFFRNLAMKPGSPNIIFICWDSTERDETNKLVFKMNFTPKLQKDIPGIVDIIGYITGIDGDPDHRVLTFEFSTRTDAKMRRNLSSAAATIPHKLYYGTNNLPMADLLRTLREGKVFPADKYRLPGARAGAARA